MAVINEQFILAKTKANFLKRLDAGDIKDTSVVFIEDKDQIWTKGKYYSSIPKGGKNNQVLSWEEDGVAKWDSVSNILPNLEEILAYGVLWTKGLSDPHLIRIGNMALHKTLPIQSQLKGCIAQGNKIIYWLNESDWRFKKDKDIRTVTIAGNKIVNPVFNTLQYEGAYLRIDNQIVKISSIDIATTTATLEGTVTDGEKSVEFGAVLNGYDGTVRIFCPEFYIKSYTKNDIYLVWISTNKIDDSWAHQESLLIDAYRCTVLNTVPANMGYLSTLPLNSTISIVNNHDYCRGGNNDKNWDKYLTEDTCRTLLNKPRTAISRSTMRTYAKNSKSKLLSYKEYKNILYWLWVIEYANFNSQERFISDLTSEGYRLGGMGDGVTVVSNWAEYNGTYPITPCGYCNSLGNNTGVVDMPSKPFVYHVSNNKDINSFNKDTAAATMAGSTNSVNITNVLKANTRYLWKAWNLQTGQVTYSITGLQAGLTIEFFSGSAIIATTSSDGDITVNWPIDNRADRCLRSQFTGVCNITISIKSAVDTDVTLSRNSSKVPRWRGFDNPFGDIWTNLDGIIIDADADKHKDNMNYIYVCTDSDKYADTLTSDYRKVGEEIHADGWTKEFNLGDEAHIIPYQMGGNTTLGKCDYHWTGSKNNTLRTLLVGGHAGNGSDAGLGDFYSRYGVAGSAAYVGFRSASAFVLK